MKIDPIDRRLLRLIQTDNRLSLKQLAKDVGSSRSVVQRRLRRLRRAGIVRHDIAVLDARALGVPETFIVHLEIRPGRSELLAGFRRMIEGLPEIQQCYFTTGSLNCVAILLLPDTSALDEFVALHFTDSPYIRRYRTRLVLRPLKIGLSVPIEASCELAVESQD